MKKIIALFVLALALVSCEKEVRFKGEQTESKLVLYCNAIAGQNLAADVSVSVFFLDRRNGNGDFTEPLDTLKGSVKVYVNGSETPYVMEYSPLEPDYYYYIDDDGTEILEAMPPSTLRYSCGYVPEPGDRIRVLASFPGYDDVSGETVVPKNNLNIVSYSTTAIQSDESTRYEVTAIVDDPGDMPLYYAVFPYIREAYDGYDGVFEYRLDINSSDVVFVDATDQLESLIEGETGSSHYFSNDLIYGRKHEFKFTFDVRDYYGKNDDDDTEYTLFLNFQTLSDSFYYHMSSMNKLENSTFGLFGEGVTLYSNVRGGYGTVCASASNSVYLPFK